MSASEPARAAGKCSSELPRLIALDLDGTLLPESKRLTELGRCTLAELDRRGVAIALATGKFLHLAEATAAEMDHPVAVVALDGARVRDRGDRHERGIPRDVLLEILSLRVETHWHVLCDSGRDEMLLASPQIERFTYVTRLWASGARRVSDLRDHVVGDPGIVCIYGPSDEMTDLHADLSHRHGELSARLVPSPLTFGSRVTLQARGVSKGAGLALLAERLGVALEECMVFGDWHNDLSMFATDAHAVAMANAVPEVKAAADEVTEHDCEHDGVARFLRDRFL